MLQRFIRFFIERHLLTNMFFAVMLLAGIGAWYGLKKEELPDVTFNTVRITVTYPGASADEVEYHVTQPLEEVLGSVEEIYRLSSSTAAGTSVITAEIERGAEDIDAVLGAIRQEVLSVDLPDAIRDTPRFRVFKTSRKAIIDIGIISTASPMLGTGERRALQSKALELENRLLALPEVSRVDRSGWLEDEIHINVDPRKLLDYDIPFNTVMEEITRSNVRQPAGSIETLQEPRVTIYGELRTPEELESLAVQGGFEGQVVRLKDIATIDYGHEKNQSILKINGYEGIFLKVTKSSSTGILDAISAVDKAVEHYRSVQPEGTPLRVVSLDDESLDLQNRLSIIGINGSIGFVLILIVLFIFLDARSGFWVALGIPFSFCFTLACALLAGYSVNNITLAAVIIVMGIVVDDALVIAENIRRSSRHGASLHEAAAEGTSMMALPVTASIITTCIAFIPLFFFEGRFGSMVSFIPAVITLMLAGSLLESLFILPGHMTLLPAGHASPRREHWFDRWEQLYAQLLRSLLAFRWPVIALFTALFAASLLLGASSLSFVMFPDEETRQIRITGQAPEGNSQKKTAELTRPLEEIIMASAGREVIGLRNEIARSRRGSAVGENAFRMRVEIVPKEQRQTSADELIRQWKAAAAKAAPRLEKLKFSKTRHGQDSGSAVEILVKDNSETRRREERSTPLLRR
ncbi:efflux RND transporter permease subunit [Prosthecochloris sp. ZM_2]|uniref:efflux RND transporter permease subunit n=1 Tax=Prosthecochloris sp. ZM_2 TaxID=2045206 RepID=UPI000F0983F9|nr:efflux RND transporter permease subunit [Prosthecochloris sp. ZM_2]